MNSYSPQVDTINSSSEQRKRFCASDRAEHRRWDMCARAQIYAVKPKIKTADKAKIYMTTRDLIHLPQVLQRIKNISKLHCKLLPLAAVMTAMLGWHNGVLTAPVGDQKHAGYVLSVLAFPRKENKQQYISNHS